MFSKKIVILLMSFILLYSSCSSKKMIYSYEVTPTVQELDNKKLLVLQHVVYKDKDNIMIKDDYNYQICKFKKENSKVIICDDLIIKSKDKKIIKYIRNWNNDIQKNKNTLKR